MAVNHGTEILAVLLGIGLAASAGFRVFVPLFAASVAGHYGLLSLSGSWQWLGSPLAMLVLGAAVLVESASYLIPYVDHALDVLAVPLSGVAGTLLVMSQTAGLDPALSWGHGPACLGVDRMVRARPADQGGFRSGNAGLPDGSPSPTSRLCGW